MCYGGYGGFEGGEIPQFLLIDNHSMLVIQVNKANRVLSTPLSLRKKGLEIGHEYWS